MSRRIEPKASVTISEEEAAWRRSDGGKLLFTSYQDRNCALLLQNNRLTAASFFSDEAGRVGAIYIGKVKNMVKNIDACFVEIAKGEICFLPLKNAAAPYILNRSYDGRLLEGDELLVQVVRDAQKSKRASVTAQVSLSNEYFVISLGSARVGYSSKLSPERKKALKKMLADSSILDPEDNCRLTQDCCALLSEEEKNRLKAEGLGLESFKLPSIGLVVRTKAEEERKAEELSGYFYDISAKFVKILYTAMYRNCFSCLKEADAGFGSIISRFVEACQDSDSPMSSPEIVTDQEALYGQIKKYCEERKIRAEVRLYSDSLISLSSLYSIQSRMETALGSRVWLKSGAYLVIEPTEALTVIDVNSGKYETEGDAQAAYRKINMEAAEEVAIQLRLRNLSGIIIVDFINMQSGADNAQLMRHLRSLVKRDRVKTTVVDMTPLGLVEITREKINKSLREQYADKCAGKLTTEV